MHKLKDIQIQNFQFQFNARYEEMVSKMRFIVLASWWSIGSLSEPFLQRQCIKLWERCRGWHGTPPNIKTIFFSDQESHINLYILKPSPFYPTHNIASIWLGSLLYDAPSLITLELAFHIVISMPYCAFSVAMLISKIHELVSIELHTNMYVKMLHIWSYGHILSPRTFL